MKPSFEPLEPDAVVFLSEATGIDFMLTDFTTPRWFCVTVRSPAGELMGVATGEFKTWFDAHFSCAIADRRCMSRRLLRTIFTALFSRAVRITALVSPDNETAAEQTRRMGFVYEGFIRKGVEGNRDALMFGMLREDCPFLPGYEPALATVQPAPFFGGFHGLHS
jgi:hypothetical protein